MKTILLLALMTGSASAQQFCSTTPPEQGGCYVFTAQGAVQQWTPQKKAPHPAKLRLQSPLIGDVTMKTIREERPKLSAEYRVQLTQEAKMTLTCEYSQYVTSYTYLENENYKRECTGTLTQRDGKVIGFVPGEVADKLIEPNLVPLVQQWSAELVKRDARDVRARTDYWDQLGQRWVRTK